VFLQRTHATDRHLSKIRTRSASPTARRGGPGWENIYTTPTESASSRAIAAVTPAIHLPGPAEEPCHRGRGSCGPTRGTAPPTQASQRPRERARDHEQRRAWQKCQQPAQQISRGVKSAQLPWQSLTYRRPRPRGRQCQLLSRGEHHAGGAPAGRNSQPCRCTLWLTQPP
jgi:hypothetical protein